MYIILACFIGTLITLMVMFNSVLSVEAGHLLSLLVLHIVGVSVASCVLLFKKNKIKGKKLPFYFYSAGMLGVLIVYSNNLCFNILGASVTLSLGILGQSLGAILIDSTGFLGMKKHPFDSKKIAGFLTIFAGVLMMVDQWEFQLLYILLAFLAGMFVIMTMVFNSQLGLNLGIFQATRVNYFVGLVTVLLIIVLGGFEMGDSLSILKGINPIYIFGGGVTGVMIVASINFVVPKIPTIYTTVLMFLGQIITGLLIDYFLYDRFSVRILTGAVIVLSGLVINMCIDKYQSIVNQKKCACPS